MTAPVAAARAEINLNAIPHLSAGEHADLAHGACVMEAISYLAGEAWSDHPVCACPVISTFLRSWNDALPDDERDALLRPLIPALIGTRSTMAVESRRSMMAADWLIREHAPAWLRLAGLTASADALASLPEITDVAQCPSLMPALQAARSDARAAGAAAWDAAGDAAWAAAGDAARDAAWDAAGAAAGAGAAARDAAWDAARDSLNPTRRTVQQSALALVHRMIGAAP